jgi:hypothetical protein
MKYEKNTKNIILMISVLLLIAISRVLQNHFQVLPNFSPMMAIAIFSGAFISDKRLAIAAFFVPMFVSDIFIGFHTSMLAVYGCFLITLGIGILMQKKITPFRIFMAAVGSSIVFFVVTNFSSWMFEAMYPRTFSGIIECYIAAIPFYRNTLLSNLAYSIIFFGSYAALSKNIPVLIKD